jgi:hypothetical protein
VKIYVAAEKALRKKERQDETHFITKMAQVFWVSPPLNANVPFCRFILNLTRFMTKLRVLVLCFPYFTDNSNVSSCKRNPKPTVFFNL